MSSTIRIDRETHRILQELANGGSMQVVLRKAVAEYRRKWLLEATNAAYAALRQDPAAWGDEQAERAAWDNTLGDGLEDD